MATVTTLDYHLYLLDAWDPLEKLQLEPETAQLDVAALSGPSDVSQIMGQQEYQWSPEEAAVMGDIGEGLFENPFGLVSWDAVTDNSDAVANRTGLFNELDNWW